MFLSGVGFGVRHLSSLTRLSACTPNPSPGRELPGELEGRRAGGLLSWLPLPRTARQRGPALWDLPLSSRSRRGGQQAGGGGGGPGRSCRSAGSPAYLHPEHLPLHARGPFPAVRNRGVTCPQTLRLPAPALRPSLPNLFCQVDPARTAALFWALAPVGRSRTSLTCHVGPG